MEPALGGLGRPLDGGERSLGGSDDDAVPTQSTPPSTPGGSQPSGNDTSTIPVMLPIPGPALSVESGGGGADSENSDPRDKYIYYNCKDEERNYLDLQDGPLKSMYKAACEEVAGWDQCIAAGPYNSVWQARRAIAAGKVENPVSAIVATNLAITFGKELAKLPDSAKSLAADLVKSMLHVLHTAPQERARVVAKRDLIKECRLSLPDRNAKKQASKVALDMEEAEEAAGCTQIVAKRKRKSLV